MYNICKAFAGINQGKVVVFLINKCVLKYYTNRVTEPPSYNVLTHRHDFWELVYYDGFGTSTINGITLNYLPGTYVIIPRDILHSEVPQSRSELYILGFEAELEIKNFPTILFFDDEKRTIKNTLENIGNEIKMESAYYSERMNLLMRDVLLLSLRSCATRNRKDISKLEMIINYIDTYCTTEIDFKALSNSMNYSYDHLRHYFKSQTGISLKQYAINKRVDIAKEKLATGMPVAKVSDRCGYSSPAYFSAIFRKVTGMTPSEYQSICMTVTSDYEWIPCTSEDSE